MTYPIRKASRVASPHIPIPERKTMPESLLRQREELIDKHKCEHKVIDKMPLPDVTKRILHDALDKNFEKHLAKLDELIEQRCKEECDECDCEDVPADVKKLVACFSEVLGKEVTPNDVVIFGPRKVITPVLPLLRLLIDDTLKC